MKIKRWPIQKTLAILRKHHILKKMILIQSPLRLYLQSKLLQGELAQLARALAWHARGHRFDSGILHQMSLPK